MEQGDLDDLELMRAGEAAMKEAERVSSREEGRTVGHGKCQNRAVRERQMYNNSYFIMISSFW